MRLFVGNLSYQTSEADLRRHFESFGQVVSVAVVTDRETGRSRGFGFVEFARREDGLAAVEGINGKEIDGRALTVNEGRPREEKRSGGGGSFRRGGPPSRGGMRG